MWQLVSRAKLRMLIFFKRWKHFQRIGGFHLLVFSDNCISTGTEAIVLQYQTEHLIKMDFMNRRLGCFQVTAIMS